MICNTFSKKARQCGGLAKRLLHQQHLACALDGAGEPSLVMRGQASVFARQDASLVRDVTPEEIGVLWLECIDGEIHRGFGSWSATFGGGGAAASARGAVCIGLACHII